MPQHGDQGPPDRTTRQASGSAAAQRAYFQQCVENNGKMPDGAPSQPPK